MSSLRTFLAVLALLTFALALHAWTYWPYLADEALVSLRYAQRLASGHGLTWNDGERVEGYASLLWVVTNAAVGSLAGFVASARALGFMGMLLAVAAIGLEPRTRSVSLPRLVVGGALLVATAPIAIGSIGGLEPGLVAGLVALSLRLLERSAWTTERAAAAGTVLVFLALARADAVFVVVGLLAGAACLPRPSRESARRVAVLAIPCAVVVIGHFVIRRVFYGAWWPSAATTSGLAHAGTGLASAGMLVLLALVATVHSARRGERWGLVMPWSVVLSTTMAIVVTGGDAAPGFGKLVPALVALCFLVADEVAAEWSRIFSQRMLVLPILGLCLILHVTQSSETPDSRRAKKELSARNDLAVGQTLKTSFASKRPLLAVDRRGALPFASEFESIDLSGLLTKVVAPNPAPSHRAPDVVVFRELSKPEHAAGRALMASRTFSDDYQSILVRGVPDEDGAEFWVRREGGRLGVVRAPDRIEVPGYFFSGQASRAVSDLDRNGALVAELSARKPGLLRELAVPAGIWRFEVFPSSPPVAVEFRCAELSMQRGSATTQHAFELDHTTRVGVAIAPDADSRGFALRSLVLTRVPQAPSVSTCVRTGTPLRIAAGALASEAPSRTHWSHPKYPWFGEAGAIVELGSRGAVALVEVSLNRNTAYLLELRRDGEVVWTKNVERNRERRGRPIVTNRFELPKPAPGGRFELFVKRRHGDSPATIGHVVLR